MSDAIVVGAQEDVLEGGRFVVDVDGVEIGIFRLDGELYAWVNRCLPGCTALPMSCGLMRTSRLKAMG